LRLHYEKSVSFQLKILRSILFYFVVQDKNRSNILFKIALNIIVIVQSRNKQFDCKAHAKNKKNAFQ